MDLIQLKIKKDASVIKYVKIIREFDGSMSMGDIKRKIENGVCRGVRFGGVRRFGRSQWH